MERETELTQSWNPELAALSEKGGLLKGIPLHIGGEMRNLSVPLSVSLQEDDGTDISLKDWQLGPRNVSLADSETAPPFSIKPFRGGVRSRFSPAEPRVDEAPSSPDHLETPATPRTPLTSSGTLSGSASPSHSSGEHSDPARREPARETPRHPVADAMGSPRDGVATEPNRSPAPAAGPSPDPALRARSLRVSFKESNPTTPATAPPPLRTSSSAPPVVRHRSLLKSRSLLPSKDVKALQPKWESSTKIGPATSTPSPSLFSSKPHVQAPLHGIKARKGSTAAKRARGADTEPEPEPEFQSSSGYLSEGRCSGGRGSLDWQSAGDEFHAHRDDFDESGRILTPSPPPPNNNNNNNHSRGRWRIHARHADDSDDEEMKGGMLCGGGIADTKLSGELARLLSKLCRVSLPLPGPSAGSHPRQGRGRRSSNNNNNNNSSSNGRSKLEWAGSQSWDPSVARDGDAAVLGRHDSLKLLSERCSTAPAPTYDLLHKPRKIRTHEPHQHFYRTISKTLDQKLKS